MPTKTDDWCYAHGWHWREMEPADMRSTMEFTGHILLNYDPDSETLRIRYHYLETVPHTEAEIQAMDEAEREVSDAHDGRASRAP